MKKKIRLIIIIVSIIVAVTVIVSYRGMVTQQENVESSYINLDVMLQRKADLIPSLVSTVKGYIKNEYDAIGEVTEARTKLVNANSPEEKSSANNELTETLDSLMAVIENYADLKDSSDFRKISDELDEIESRITVAAKDYNDKVKILNSTIQKFPNNLLSRITRVEQRNDFELNEKSAQTPSVIFEEVK